MIRTLVGIVGLILLGVLAASLVFKMDQRALLSTLGMSGAGCIFAWILITLGVNDRRGRAGR